MSQAYPATATWIERDAVHAARFTAWQRSQATAANAPVSCDWSSLRPLVALGGVLAAGLSIGSWLPLLMRVI